MSRDPDPATHRGAPFGRWAAGALLAAGAAIVTTGLAAAYFTVRPIRRRRWKTLTPRRPSQNGRQFQSVRFPSADGLMLAGMYGEGSPGYASIIVCHGWPGDMDDMLDLAGALRGAGFHVLAFDFRSCGESERGPVTLGDRESQDVLGAVRYLRERHPRQGRRIGAVGLSMGAAAVILAGARAPDIEAVVADSSYARLDVELDRVFGRLGGPVSPLASVPARWLAERLIATPLDHVAPVEAIPRLSPRPVLIIHGTRDRLTDIQDAQALYQACGNPKTLWLVEGAGHGRTRRVGPDAYDRRIIGFFRQHLAGTA